MDGIYLVAMQLICLCVCHAMWIPADSLWIEMIQDWTWIDNLSFVNLKWKYFVIITVYW